MEKKCERCGSTEKLTVDHVIPKWLYKRLHYFKALGNGKLKISKNLGARNKQVLCEECNSSVKQGFIQLDHPVTQEVLFPIIEALYLEMQKHKPVEKSVVE